MSPDDKATPPNLIAAVTGLATAAAAKLKGPPSAEPAAPASTLRPDTQATELARAPEQAQAAVKWLIAALAATASLVYGAGPVLTRPELSLADDLGQIIVAAIFAVVGLVGVGAIVVHASEVFVVRVVDLYSLASDVESTIVKQQSRFFPPLIVNVPWTVASFAEALRDERKKYVQEVAELRYHITRVAEAEANGDANAKVAAIKDRDKSLKDEIPAALQSLEVYESKRDLIVAFARTAEAERLWRRIRLAVIWGGLLAVVGAVGFTLSLASPTSEDEQDVGEGIVTTTMTSTGTTASEVLWDRLALSSCALPTATELPVGGDPADAAPPNTVAIVLLEGDGSSADPWLVQPVPIRAACVVRTFAVTRDVVTVVPVESNEIKVEYGERAE